MESTIKVCFSLSTQYIDTITADNGKEFVKHQEIAKNLEISFYFCKPYHSRERGAQLHLKVEFTLTTTIKY